MKKFNLIFLNTGELLLSSKAYKSWEKIQDEYENYSASLDFNSLEDVIGYICMDYKLEKERAESLVADFAKNKKGEVIELKF